MEKLPKIEYAPDDYEPEPSLLFHQEDKDILTLVGEGFQKSFYIVNGYRPELFCYHRFGKIAIEVYSNPQFFSKLEEDISNTIEAIEKQFIGKQTDLRHCPRWIIELNRYCGNMGDIGLNIILTEKPESESIILD